MSTTEPVATKENPGTQGEEMWTFTFFSVFSDWKVCLSTFCCPCYTIGRNAAYFGEDCPLVGGLFALGCGLGFGPLLRWRIRQQKNIRGSMTSDVLAHFLCPCCALIQENKEIYGMSGSTISEQMPINVNITRQ